MKPQGLSSKTNQQATFSSQTNTQIGGFGEQDLRVTKAAQSAIPPQPSKIYLRGNPTRPNFSESSTSTNGPNHSFRGAGLSSSFTSENRDSTGLERKGWSVRIKGSLPKREIKIDGGQSITSPQSRTTPELERVSSAPDYEPDDELDFAEILEFNQIKLESKHEAKTFSTLEKGN